MRNGDKVVYGEVQKIRTRTPSVAIKNFAVRIKRITIPLPSDSVLFETSISISEPLKVFPLTTSLNARDYGFVFCKAADTTKLVNANDTVFPTGTGIFDMRFPSTNIVTTDPKISIDKRENISDILNPSRKSFFSDVTNNYYTRAYIKLNRGGVIEGGVIRGDDIKYYYSNLITFPKKTSSLFNFKMPIIP